MRLPALFACLSASLVAAGCGGKNDGAILPETPPPTAVAKLPGLAAYRPGLVVGGTTSDAGTAFVIKAPSGRLLALTAAHLLDPGEWATLSSAHLSTMDGGQRVVSFPGKPAFVGRSFDEPDLIEVGTFPIFDTSEDFAVWALPRDAEVPPLELGTDPQVNQWVWVVGQEAGKPLGFYRAKVTRVRDGSYVAKQHDEFEVMGFSGGPVLDVTGKLVGTTLAAESKGGRVQGATVGTIRQRFARY